MSDVLEKVGAPFQRARRIYDEERSFDKALDRLIEEVAEDPALTDCAVRTACKDWMTHAVGSFRQHVGAVTGLDAFTGASMAGNPNRFQAAFTARMSLYDYPLPNTRKPIGDATVNDLSDAKDHYLGISETMKKRGEALRRLQEALARSNRKTVRQAFKLEKLKEILGEALEGEE